MKIVCAWCKKDMGEKPPYEDKSVTHSICPECKAKHFPGEEKPIVSEAEAFQKRLEYELKKEGFTREPSTVTPEVRLTLAEEQELRGLKVIIANIQAQQAEGWVLDEGAKEQLASALARQAELTAKVKPVTPEVTKDLSRIETRIKDVKGKIAEFQEALVKYPSDRGIIERDLTERKAILQSLEQERARLIAISKAEAGTHPLILKQYPIGEVPKEIPIGGLDVPVPPLRGTELPPKKPKNIPENAVIRTKEKFDNAVKHLGYESVSFSQEELDALDKVIPTDIDIINASQKRLRETEAIRDEKLDSRQLAHLKLSQAITTKVLSTPIPVYAAIIPPASDRVRTAGMYGTTTQTIYISQDQLFSGRNTIDTLVHEMAHHRQYQKTGEAEDLTPSHAEAMTNIAAQVTREVETGEFDELLKEVSW